MDAIVAVYSDWGIGADGTQPVILKADRQHFVELTRGRTVIVGRPNAGRFSGRQTAQGAQKHCPHPAECGHRRRGDRAQPGGGSLLCADDAMVLGGQSVFRDMMPYIDRVFVTKINCCPQSDSYFENLDVSADGALRAKARRCARAISNTALFATKG